MHLDGMRLDIHVADCSSLRLTFRSSGRCHCAVRGGSALGISILYCLQRVRVCLFSSLVARNVNTLEIMLFSMENFMV